ncbi:MAG: trimethylamine methyltransferase family protein [Proteobacteria bacterium]|nr:trimethylamine methyltransferase family protein [Pseudomonadota bacterium]MBU1585430.1 trimethylamine methyltransferase family protein [Pseudomonadota bacterium]MBU2454649.1 trimethylamine methyltransferase family protein [Pseudomonadota bacterium]MBU2629228.1 trimethylamine methyltransferase family protein [Pseudomonadota bacterium]
MFDLKPTLTVMTDEQRNKVHTDALFILEDTGVVVDDQGARQRFEKAIGKSRDDHRIRIPKDLVQWAITAAPSDIQIYDRLGRPCFELKGDGTKEAVFGIGVTNLFYQDPFKNDIQPFHRHHMAAATGLGHNLDAFDFISTPGVIQDFPPETADILGVLEMVANTTKPLVMLISNSDCFHPSLNLLEHLNPDISARPFVIPYVNPITPLVLNAETTMKMDAAINRGLPLIFSNYGMSGATCPITPAGTLTLLTAELLAGLVYSQLVKEGAPIILGSLPAAFDMKNAGSFYSPATLLLNLACAEMVTAYNIPHCGTSGSGNGWGADLLASTTLCINHFSSCVGAAGMVPFVGGSFDSLVFSPELVVFSNDLIHQSRLFASGFSLEDENIGFSDISTIGPGGNFLLSKLTGKYFRDSQFSSTIWPFLTLDKWKKMGAPKADKILQDRTCNLLNTLSIPNDHNEIISKGEAFLGLM